MTVYGRDSAVFRCTGLYGASSQTAFQLIPAEVTLNEGEHHQDGKETRSLQHGPSSFRSQVYCCRLAVSIVRSERRLMNPPLLPTLYDIGVRMHWHRFDRIGLA